jgi:hypothetical protein
VPQAEQTRDKQAFVTGLFGFIRVFTGIFCSLPSHETGHIFGWRTGGDTVTWLIILFLL